MKQSLTLLFAIVIGILLPQLHVLSPLITYLLGIMLFTSFLRAKISWKIFLEKKVYIIFLCNLFIPWVAYFLVLPFGKELAFIAFFVGIIPTAMAAPAVISVLKGNVEFVIASVIITNFGVGLLLPFFASYISPVMFSTSQMLIKISLLLGVPFLLAECIKAIAPQFKTKLIKNTSFVFYLWASIIIIAMSNASYFLHSEWREYSEFLIPIFVISGVLCIINFVIGYWVGGNKFRQEASQSLGQKNPMLMIWVALEFFTPLVALGPTFYILFHNIVNAYKMMRKNQQ